MPRLDAAPASWPHSQMLWLGTRSFWKGGPASPHDPTSEHPPSSAGTPTASGGVGRHDVPPGVLAQSFLRAGPAGLPDSLFWNPNADPEGRLSALGEHVSVRP